jgi:hypothetical protein
MEVLMSHKKRWTVNLLDKDSVTTAIKEVSYSLMSTLECRKDLMAQLPIHQAEDVMDQQNRLVEDLVYGILELRLAHYYAMDDRKEDAGRQVQAFTATLNKLADEIQLLKEGQKGRNAMRRRMLDMIDDHEA